MSKTFKLSLPIKTHKGDIDSITLREPRAAEVIDYGYPFRFSADGTMPDGPAAARWISRLSGLDRSEVGEMALRDWQDICEWLASTFGPAADEGNSDTPPKP